MPSLKLTIPHELGQEEAAIRLKGFLEKVKQRYQNQVSDLEEKWVENALDFAFKTYGFHIKGRMVVEPADVKFEGQIPFAAMMFKGKIEQTIRDEMKRLLTSPARGRGPEASSQVQG
jgi:Putative polyhydroxyalkanoic acid system protein (PHA_gran_rgn)